MREFIICEKAFLQKLLPNFIGLERLSSNLSEQVQLYSIGSDNFYQQLEEILLGHDINIQHLYNIDEKIKGAISLRKLANILPIPLFLRDTNGYFLGCNNSYAQFTGIDEQELVGKSLFEIFPQNYANEYLTRDKELIEQNDIQIYETKIPCKDLKEKDVIFRKIIVSDELDQKKVIVGIMIDISKRKNMEHALWEYRNHLEETVLARTADLKKANSQLIQEIQKRRQSETALSESETLLRTIFDSSYDAMILLDTNLNVIDINDRALLLLQVGRKENYRITQWVQTYLQDPYNGIVEYWEGALKGEVQFFEWRFYFPNSQNIDVDIFIRRIDIANKHMMLINIRDITERKKVESLLLQEHNKVKIALKNEVLISTIASMLNTAENFFEILDTILHMVKQTLNLDDTCFFSFYPEYNELLQKSNWLIQLEQSNKTAKHNNEILQWIRGRILQNKPIFLPTINELPLNLSQQLNENNINSLTAIPLKISGTPYGMMTYQTSYPAKWNSKHYGLFSTISVMIANAWERYHHTQALLKAERKNTETVQLLENSSRLASIGVIAAGITHEINQPLNAIKINADSILFWNKRNDHILPDMFIDKVKKISEGVDRIDGIIKHMRSFWVPQDVKGNDIISVKDAVDNTLNIIESQLKSHGIEFISQFKTDHFTIRGNLIHVEQIIINLVVNAMHALDTVQQQEKQIELNVEQQEGKLLLQISDNGPGISQDFVDKLYDPFFSTKAPGHGMGLGLAVVKRLVDNLNGTIELLNDKQTGANFLITFPLFVEG